MALPKISFSADDFQAAGKQKQLKNNTIYQFEVGEAATYVKPTTGDMSLIFNAYAVGSDGKANPEARVSHFMLLPINNTAWEEETGYIHEINKAEAAKGVYRFLAAVNPDFPRKPRWNPDTQTNLDPETGEVLDQEEANDMRKRVNTAVAEALNQLVQDVGDQGHKITTFLKGNTFFAKTYVAESGRTYVNLIIDRNQVDDVEYDDLFVA